MTCVHARAALIGCSQASFFCKQSKGFVCSLHLFLVYGICFFLVYASLAPNGIDCCVDELRIKFFIRRRVLFWFGCKVRENVMLGNLRNMTYLLYRLHVRLHVRLHARSATRSVASSVGYTLDYTFGRLAVQLHVWLNKRSFARSLTRSVGYAFGHVTVRLHVRSVIRSVTRSVGYPLG